MRTISHPTSAEIHLYLRRARSLRSNAVCGFFRWLADRLTHRRYSNGEHATTTARWA